MVSATLSRNQMVISGRKVQLWEEIKKKDDPSQSPCKFSMEEGGFELENWEEMALYRAPTDGK